MKQRLVVMLIGSFALHAWLLWAAPVRDVRAPSGSVALKLGQLKLAMEMTNTVEAAKNISGEVSTKPKASVKTQSNPEARSEQVEKKADKQQAMESSLVQQPVDKARPSSGEVVVKTDSAENADFAEVAASLQSNQHSVSEEPVLVERPTFSSPPQAPVYPELARQRRQQGTVVVEVQLDQAGAQVVRRLLQSSGVDSLDEAALRAVKEWNFLPYREGGRARHSKVRLPIRFSL